MTSLVQIWNMAMGHLGQTSTIQSENEKSQIASACRTFWPSARRSALSAFDWSFAKTYADLSQLDDGSPTDAWGYAYALPLECLSVRFIDRGVRNGMADPVPYEIIRLDDDRKALLCDLSECKIRYTADVLNVNMYEPQFVESAAFVLAAAACMQVTRKMDMKQGLLAQARLITDSAAASSMNENRQDPPRETASLRSRL